MVVKLVGDKRAYIVETSDYKTPGVIPKGSLEFATLAKAEDAFREMR